MAGKVWNEPPIGFGTAVVGKRTPVMLASELTVGSRLALALSTWLCAARARASALARSGLSLSASTINALSCLSPSRVHQSVAGHAARVIAAFAVLRSACRLALLVS